MIHKLSFLVFFFIESLVDSFTSQTLYFHLFQTSLSCQEPPHPFFCLLTTLSRMSSCLWVGRGRWVVANGGAIFHKDTRWYYFSGVLRT